MCWLSIANDKKYDLLASEGLLDGCHYVQPTFVGFHWDYQVQIACSATEDLDGLGPITISQLILLSQYHGYED